MEYFPMFFDLKDLQVINPSFVNFTKPLGNNIGETFVKD